MRLLVLASGRGSNFEAILKASRQGKLPVNIVGLLCDRDCNAINIANEAKIPVTILKPKDYPDRDEYLQKLSASIVSHKPDYIVLAGYMRILPSEVIDLYPLRIINIHPSLLPDFKGKDSIKQAWDAGVKHTGVTVHFVNDKMDAGVIISQEKVEVPSSMDELEQKIHAVEHKLYVEVLRMLALDLKFLLVSKCLLGENVRYDGNNKYSKRSARYAESFKGRVMDVCPEVMAGMGVPRPPMELVDGRLIAENGKDLTDLLNRTIETILSSIPKGSKVIAILKEKSPCCGKYSPQGLLTKELLMTLKGDLILVNEEEL